MDRVIDEIFTQAVYEATCDKCKWHMCLMSEQAIQNLSEAHMMETGHTVQIKEVN